MIVNLEALKKRYTGSSSFGCNGCQAKHRLIQQLLSELTDVEDLRTQLAAKEREITERDAVIRELVEAGDAAIKGDYSDWDTVTPKALALLGGEKGEGR